MKNFVYCYRYMWKLNDSDKICFKIVTDIEEGLSSFEQSLLSLDNVVNIAREYLHQYDISKIGVFEPILNNGGKSNEKV